MEITEVRLLSGARDFQFKVDNGSWQDRRLIGIYPFYLVQDHDGVDNYKELIDQYSEWGCTAARCMVWPAGENVWPAYGSSQFYNRVTEVAKYCLSKGIIPIVVVHATYDNDGPKRGDAGAWASYAWSIFDADHSHKMADALRGLPCFVEIGNEVQEAGIEWQKSAIDHWMWKAEGDQQILVSTGFGTGGMSVEDLIGSGADGYSAIPASTEHHNHDGDHFPAVNSVKYSEGYNDVYDGFDDGSPIILSLIPGQPDALPNGNWKVEILLENNPAHQGRLKATQEINTENPLFSRLLPQEPPPIKNPKPPLSVDAVEMHLRDPSIPRLGSSTTVLLGDRICHLKGGGTNKPAGAFDIYGINPKGWIEILFTEEQNEWNNPTSHKSEGFFNTERGHGEGKYVMPRVVQVGWSLTIGDVPFHRHANCETVQVNLSLNTQKYGFGQTDVPVDDWVAASNYPFLLGEDVEPDCWVCPHWHTFTGPTGALMREEWFYGYYQEKWWGRVGFRKSIFNSTTGQWNQIHVEKPADIRNNPASLSFPCYEGKYENPKYLYYALPGEDFSQYTNDALLAESYKEIKLIRKPPPTQVKRMRDICEEWHDRASL